MKIMNLCIKASWIRRWYMNNGVPDYQEEKNQPIGMSFQLDRLLDRQKNLSDVFQRS